MTRAVAGADRGSVLMLVPAAVLVLVVLGAIAVDSAVVHLAQRQLANETAAVANDVAGAAVDDDAFYSSGTQTIDRPKATAIARAAFDDRRRPPSFDSWGGEVTVDDRSVTVEAWAEVRYVFAGALPGIASSTRVTARSTATSAGG